MSTGLDSDLFRGLAEKQILIPIIENLISTQDWPEYTVKGSYHEMQDDDYFHPSSHCYTDKIWVRWLYYMIQPHLRSQTVPRRAENQLIKAGVAGTASHAFLQSLLVYHQVIQQSDVEVPLINEERHWRGHMDLRYLEWAVDIKTISPGGFDMLFKPKLDWVKQLNVYMDGEGKEKGLFLVQRQGYPFEFKEFKIYRDDKLLRSIYDVWEATQEHIALGYPPSHCCTQDSAWATSKCGARVLCWN